MSSRPPTPQPSPRRDYEELAAAHEVAQAEVRRWQERSRRLAADAVAAEQRERRRLAQTLHDDAVQTLLAAAQDLGEAAAGRAGALERAQSALEDTIEQLRRAIFDMHPVVLEHVGLEAALRAAVEGQSRRAGFSWSVAVDAQAAGAHDQLLLSLARELVTNVAKHAGAQSVLVAVERTDETVVLRVTDDGRGLTPDRREAAVRDGHVGLATCGARVEALGGRLDAWERPGGGTIIRASIPVGVTP